MSIIGTFSLCPREGYEVLVRQVSEGRTEEARETVLRLREALTPAPEGETCSGVVFTALFTYFQTVLDTNLWGDAQEGGLGALWRETAGVFVMTAFLWPDRERLLALAESIPEEALTAFVNDFFQDNMGPSGRIALETLCRGLRALTPETVLIFQAF